MLACRELNYNGTGTGVGQRQCRNEECRVQNLSLALRHPFILHWSLRPTAPLEAAIEATEEAIDNSLLRAETVRGYRGTVTALPIDSTVAILKRHGALRP